MANGSEWCCWSGLKKLYCKSCRASCAMVNPLSAPFGNCLPGTELVQSPFRTEFSMGSLSRWYRRSLRRQCQFLWRYRRSLRRSAAARSVMPIVARLTKHRKTLLNIVKHHETLVKHCDTSWNVRNHREPLVNIMKHFKHCETSWNT